MKTKIIYEDNSILVVYKPAGFATQSANVASPDVVSEIKNYLMLTKKHKNPYVGLVHRLDQPVEGLLVLALNDKVAANLSKQFSGNNESCHKEYLAVGYVQKDSNIVLHQKNYLENYLIKDSASKLAKIATKDNPQAKKAVLSYEISEQKEAFVLLKVALKTGRFHQIRVQMAGEEIPLLGDVKYGTKESMEVSAKKEIKTVALCANRLRFIHPETKKNVEFRCEPKNKVFSIFSKE